MGLHSRYMVKSGWEEGPLLAKFVIVSILEVQFWVGITRVINLMY